MLLLRISVANGELKNNGYSVMWIIWFYRI